LPVLALLAPCAVRLEGRRSFRRSMTGRRPAVGHPDRKAVPSPGNRSTVDNRTRRKQNWIICAQQNALKAQQAAAQSRSIVRLALVQNDAAESAIIAATKSRWNMPSNA
jgi:hypothetical protein